MFDKVFISYASEDIEIAKKLFNYLNSEQFEVWLDVEKLLPGQNWDFEINLALKNSDYVIVLLSSTSVRKRGYVQKEFKQAIKYCEQRLDTDIYLIPVKIDECITPENLSFLQWVNLDNPNSFEIILNSITNQRNIYIQDEIQKIEKKINENFPKRQLRKFSISEILDFKTDALNSLITICKTILTERAKKLEHYSQEENIEAYSTSFLDDWSSFKKFTLTNNSFIFNIIIGYPTYPLFGINEVEVKFKDLLIAHPELITLKKVSAILSKK